MSVINSLLSFALDTATPNLPSIINDFSVPGIEVHDSKPAHHQPPRALSPKTTKLPWTQDPKKDLSFETQNSREAQSWSRVGSPLWHAETLDGYSWDPLSQLRDVLPTAPISEKDLLAQLPGVTKDILQATSGLSADDIEAWLMSQILDAVSGKNPLLAATLLLATGIIALNGLGLATLVGLFTAYKIKNSEFRKAFETFFSPPPENIIATQEETMIIGDYSLRVRVDTIETPDGNKQSIRFVDILNTATGKSISPYDLIQNFTILPHWLQTLSKTLAEVYHGIKSPAVFYEKPAGNPGEKTTRTIIGSKWQFIFSGLELNEREFSWRTLVKVGGFLGAVMLASKAQILNTVDLVSAADDPAAYFDGFLDHKCDSDNPADKAGENCYATGGSYYEKARQDREYAKLWGSIDREDAHTGAEILLTGAGAYSIATSYSKMVDVVPGYPTKLSLPWALGWTTLYVGQWATFRGGADSGGMYQYEDGGDDSLARNWNEWEFSENFDHDTFSAYMAGRLIYAPIATNGGRLGMNATAVGYDALGHFSRENPVAYSSRLPILGPMLTEGRFPGGNLGRFVGGTTLVGGYGYLMYEGYESAVSISADQKNELDHDGDWATIAAASGASLLAADAYVHNPNFFKPLTATVKDGQNIPAYANVRPQVLTFSPEERLAINEGRYLGSTPGRYFWNTAMVGAYGYTLYQGAQAADRLWDGESENTVTDSLWVGAAGGSSLVLADAATVNIGGRVLKIKNIPSSARSAMSVGFNQERLGYYAALTVLNGGTLIVSNVSLLAIQGYENDEGYYVRTIGRSVINPNVNRLGNGAYQSMTPAPSSGFFYMELGQLTLFGPVDAQNQTAQVAGRRYDSLAKRYTVADSKDSADDLLLGLSDIESKVTTKLDQRKAEVLSVLTNPNESQIAEALKTDTAYQRYSKEAKTILAKRDHYDIPAVTPSYKAHTSAAPTNPVTTIFTLGSLATILGWLWEKRRLRRR